MTKPNLYNVGYDVGFEDGFKEAQARIEKLMAENELLRLDMADTNDTVDAAIKRVIKLEATLRTLEHWFDTDQEILDVMGNNEKADHMRKLKMIRDALTGGKDE